jgi:hypothetical protein
MQSPRTILTLAAFVVGAIGLRFAIDDPCVAQVRRAAQLPRPKAETVAAPADITPLLVRAFNIAGTAELRIKTEHTNLPGASSESTDTWAEWCLSMAFHNHTRLPLRIDSTIFIVETGAEDTQIHGHMIVKSRPLRQARIAPIVIHRKNTTYDGQLIESDLVDRSVSYGLRAFDAFDARAMVHDWGSSLGRLLVGADPKFQTRSYGLLLPEGSIEIQETVRPGVWFNDEHRTAVYFVPPEVHVGNSARVDSYQPIAILAPAGAVRTWKVQEVFVLHETPEVLAGAIGDRKRGLFTQILAANRMADYYPEATGPAFAAAAKGLREGQ